MHVQLPIAVVSAADIAKVAGQPLPTVEHWLTETARPAVAQHNGEPLYLASAAQALLDETLGCETRSLLDVPVCK